MEEIEKWADVHLLEGRYQISTFGNVKYIGRNKANIIKPSKDSRGYKNFVVSINGKRKTFMVHREVAKSFIVNSENYKIVAHINDVKTDNNVKNLKWCDHEENRKDAILNKKIYHEPGKRPAKAKLTKNDILYIMASSDSNSGLGRRFCVSESTICKIRKGRTWTKVTGMEYVKSKRRKPSKTNYTYE